MTSDRRSDLVSLVETALAAGAAGDAESAMTMFSPHVVARYADSLPFGGEHAGLPAYLSALGELNRLYRLEVLAAEVAAADGDRVLLFLDVKYTATASGRTARQRSVEVLRFTGSVVTEVDVYYRDTAQLLSMVDEP